MPTDTSRGEAAAVLLTMACRWRARRGWRTRRAGGVPCPGELHGASSKLSESTSPIVRERKAAGSVSAGRWRARASVTNDFDKDAAQLRVSFLYPLSPQEPMKAATGGFRGLRTEPRISSNFELVTCLLEILTAYRTENNQFHDA